MGSLGAILTILGGLAALLVIAAVAVAFYRASYARATIETLRESNNALTNRVSELEASEGRLKLRCDSLEREAVSLRGYVSGTEAVRELEKKVEAYHGELLAHRRELISRLDKLVERGVR
jgi:predicted RNase H-like nuclease (RuvC/YqgF family)